MAAAGRIPDRGDIYSIDVSPTRGKELKGGSNDRRYVLVLSHQSVNQLGTTLCALITQGSVPAREKGFTVTLMGSGSATQGVVTLCHVHTFDFQVRGARFIEEVDDVVVEECLDVLDVMTH